jgi:hypothetical protein
MYLTEGSMKKGPNFAGIVLGIGLVILISFPNQILGAEVSKGNILGFIYSEDGTTPVSGAVFKARNISTGSVYESSVSDLNGVFKIQGIESGVYVYGVRTEAGEFNSDGMIGVSVGENKTAKMAIAITPFEKRIKEDIEAGLEANSIEGETLVGRIIDYDPENGLAEVYILKGVLSQKDKIHALGVETDFYQKVKNLSIGEDQVKSSTAGEMARIKLENEANSGDFLYVVAEKGFALLAIVPVGVAALVGTSAAVIKVDNSSIKDVEKAASPYKNK